MINDMNDPPKGLAIRVRDHLRNDDDILALADTEFLKVKLTKAVRKKASVPRRMRREMRPRELLRAIALFVKKLDIAAAEVADRSAFPDAKDPNGHFEYRANDKFIVAYHGCNPVWFWKNSRRKWKLHKISVRRESDVPFVFEDVFPYMFGNVPLSEVNGVFHRPGVNDPERLIPHALLGVFGYFLETLNSAHKRMDRINAPYIPDVEGVEHDVRFRSDEECIVAYRRDSDTPLWCWKRRGVKQWKLYRLSPREGLESVDSFDDYALHEGEWDRGRP